MVYKKFYVFVILRVFFIVVTSIALSFVIMKTSYIYTVIGLVVIIILQTVGLINYLNKTNRYLSGFLYFLKESNASISMEEDEKSPVSDLHGYFNEIKSIIRNVRIEKENQYLYLQYIIENVGVGLISFGHNGQIELINESAKTILETPALNNINDLNRIQNGFASFILNLKPQQPQLFKLNLQHEIIHLSMKASKIKIGERNITIVTFQDIKNELDDNELDSYLKLIRVLTHEIMNSVTPINTLTRTIRNFYMGENGLRSKKELEPDVIKETVTGLDLIEERGNGLKSFVSKYRNLTRLPQPIFKKVNIHSLLLNMLKLFGDDIKQKKIHATVNVTPDDLAIYADEKLLEQVFINLIKNAISAIPDDGSGKLELTANNANSLQTVIIISDNGHGISKENINNIFTPFFTTKEHGSGIGLSLARQIMRLHKGHISVYSEVEKGTTFKLEF